MKRSDWLPEGSQADQQKRTYLDRIGDLEGQIANLEADLAKTTKAKDVHWALSQDLRVERDEAKAKIAELDADLTAFHEDRKGDAGRIDDLQGIIGHYINTEKRLETEIANLKREHSDLRGQFDKQTTHLADARKSVAGARTKLIALAVVGAVGTIWGSLGNPLPSFSDTPEQKVAKAAADPRIACVLKERTPDGKPNPDARRLVTSLQWLPEHPAGVLQTKDVSSPPEMSGLRVTGLDYAIYNNVVTVSGQVTNKSKKGLSYLSGRMFLMSNLTGGDCIPIGSQYFTMAKDVYSGSSNSFSTRVEFPASTANFEKGNVFITDIEGSFY